MPAGTRAGASTPQNIHITNLPLHQPLLAPFSPLMPSFTGDDVSIFIEHLETIGESAGKHTADLPSLVLRYCSRDTRKILENYATIWSGRDWDIAKNTLKDLYGVREQLTIPTLDKLRSWVTKFNAEGVIEDEEGVDAYYRQYMSQVKHLRAKQRISEYEEEIMFFDGIPEDLQSHVCERIPRAKRTHSDPPTTDETRTALKSLFDKDDLIRGQQYDWDLQTNEVHVDRFELSRHESWHTSTQPWTLYVPQNHPVAPPLHPTPTVNQLAHKFNELTMHQAEFQKEMQEMFSTRFATNELPAGTGAAFSSQNLSRLPQKVCFICATPNHKMGVRNCPEAQSLLRDQLVKFCESTGNLIRSDGSPLLRRVGSIAAIL